jgi:transcriptional regulator with XRE-family HTH domain
MDEKNVTGKDLCISCGLKKDTVSRLKTRGNVPSADTAVVIARYLGTTVEYLITGKDVSGYDQNVLDIASEINALDDDDRKIVIGTVNTIISTKYIRATDGRKTANLNIRCTHDELDKIKRNARDAEMTMSEYICKRCAE